jgi:hypothetical protein
MLDLTVLPPSPTSLSPTKAPPVAPMLSMTKVFMQRHVRIAFFHFLLDRPKCMRTTGTATDADGDKRRTSNGTLQYMTELKPF